MTFFQSDVVRAEMAEISELQEEVYNNVFKFPSMSSADKRYHIDVLERLLAKQRVMYTRLSLSDDPDAKQMKEQITQSAAMMGLPKGADINHVFNDMSKAVSLMKDQIDKS
jgi:hypothetical protein